jgi:hypothetical protein
LSQPESLRRFSDIFMPPRKLSINSAEIPVEYFTPESGFVQRFAKKYFSAAISTNKTMALFCFY